MFWDSSWYLHHFINFIIFSFNVNQEKNFTKCLHIFPFLFIKYQNHSFSLLTTLLHILSRYLWSNFLFRIFLLLNIRHHIFIFHQSKLLFHVIYPNTIHPHMILYFLINKDPYLISFYLQFHHYIYRHLYKLFIRYNFLFHPYSLYN